jgi:hypothetical protein
MGRNPIAGLNAIGFHTPFFLKEIKWQVKSPSLHGFCTRTASSPDNCATTALQPKHPELLRELFGQMSYTRYCMAPWQ